VILQIGLRLQAVAGFGESPTAYEEEQRDDDVQQVSHKIDFRTIPLLL
jgi:hypothetical protein